MEITQTQWLYDCGCSFHGLDKTKIVYTCSQPDPIEWACNRYGVSGDESKADARMLWVVGGYEQIAPETSQTLGRAEHYLHHDLNGRSCRRTCWHPAWRVSENTVVRFMIFAMCERKHAVHRAVFRRVHWWLANAHQTWPDAGRGTSTRG